MYSQARKDKGRRGVGRDQRNPLPMFLNKTTNYIRVVILNNNNSRKITINERMKSHCNFFQRFTV